MAEKKQDSIVHHEERAAKIRAEAAELERKQAEMKEQVRISEEEQKQNTRVAEDKLLVQWAGPVSPTDTRDDLLNRIRAMRAQDVAPVIKPLGRVSKEQIEQFEAEQKAGREAVAKAEKQMEEARLAREKARAAEGKKTEGELVPVHHPNPGMDQVFPTVKATLK